MSATPVSMLGLGAALLLAACASQPPMAERAASGNIASSDHPPCIDRPGVVHKINTRSFDEVQCVFDAAAPQLYASYVRALRDQPKLAGKLYLSITIAPAGTVLDAHVVSSQLANPAFEEQVLQIVRTLDFGATNAPEFTYPNYPIKFSPPT